MLISLWKLRHLPKRNKKQLFLWHNCRVAWTGTNQQNNQQVRLLGHSWWLVNETSASFMKLGSVRPWYLDCIPSPNLPHRLHRFCFMLTQEFSSFTCSLNLLLVLPKCTLYNSNLTVISDLEEKSSNVNYSKEFWLHSPFIFHLSYWTFELWNHISFK